MATGDGYSAGNLELVVQEISNKTLSSLDALIAKLKSVTSLLGSTSSLSKTLGSTTGRSSSGGGASLKNSDKQLKTSSFQLTKILNKVYFLRNYTKQMFQTAGKMFTLAVDYTETLNLWQVAMRNNREEADEFVKTMNKAYGISTQTLMNYQAIFRNMLSSLGGISEGTSYALSEYLTQMALDYASLYNTSIQKAMTTFQSVLSGQVRPIRSIAGYDITETTIYQLYQQLGGEKTMRQLTQTEKRLLRIYAVFQQMDSSGAIGDLNRTLGNTANQMRILSESSKELQTWFGLILEDMLKPILPYLNAFVITLTNITKAIAKMRGVKLFESGMVESVQEINEALDETQGKLLSFDRFESLNSGEEQSNLLGIDETLLSGISKYSSILSEVTGKAQELAEAWTKWWVDSDTGKLTKEAQTLLNVLEIIGIVLGSIIALNIGKKIIKLGSWILGFGKNFSFLQLSVSALVGGVLTLISAWGEMSSWGKIVTIFVSLAAAITAAAIAIHVFKANWGKALAIAGMVAGGALIVGSTLGKLTAFKNGGEVEDGIFTMNKGEIIGNFDDGSTVVANNQQIISGIQSGVYSAVVSAMKQTGGNSGIGNVYIDGRKVGQVTAGASHREMVRTGLVRVTR